MSSESARVQDKGTVLVVGASGNCGTEIVRLLRNDGWPVRAMTRTPELAPDLAAMGARPVAFTVALAAPPSLPLAKFDGLMRGLLQEAAAQPAPARPAPAASAPSPQPNLPTEPFAPVASVLPPA